MPRRGIARAGLLLMAPSTVLSILACVKTLEGEDPPRAVIETIAGTGRSERVDTKGEALAFDLSQPFGVEVGPDRALYICEVGRHRVLRLDLSSGRIAAVAGNGAKGLRGEGGPAAEACLDEPYEVRFDASGNLYVVEMMGAVIRKVEAGTGILRRVAGTGEQGYSGDGGPAAEARLKSPHSIALDGKGGLFVADIGNHRVRRIDLETGRIETIAGNGEPRLPEEGAAARGSPLHGPRALAVAGGILWIALREGHSVWKLDLSSGKLARAAGSGRPGWRDGKGGEASFNGPKGIAVIGGEVLIADTENHAIRSLDAASGIVRTVAGGGPSAQGYGGDGGPALEAKLDRPHGIAAGAGGVIYIGDSSNHRVRRVRGRGIPGSSPAR